MHRSWDVCFKRKENTRDSRRLRNGCCQGYEERFGQEHGIEETLEINKKNLFSLLNFKTQFFIIFS